MQSMGERRVPESGFNVFAMDALYRGEVRSESLAQRCGQESRPVSSSLSVTNNNLRSVEIDILDAETKRLADSESGSVQEFCDESVDARHRLQKVGDLSFR